MSDLFGSPQTGDKSYSAKDIEVLEGLEPVRRRPGMYIGGTDARGLHHLAAEVLDNAMDEAVAGHASRIDVELSGDGVLMIADNGRGVPVDPHPKFKDKSALEVILTTLHSGGKFGGKAYKTAGGLHGVGISVVNALSEYLDIEVARERRLWRQSYVRGVPKGPLTDAGPVSNRRGTTVRFRPDPEIFGAGAVLEPGRIYRMARSKAYLFRGVEIRWRCAPESLKPDDEVPETTTLHFPGGLSDFLAARCAGRDMVTPEPFTGRGGFPDDAGQMEWAIAWPADGGAFISSYCNTVPTPDGGTHEMGLRMALLKSLKAYGEMAGNKRASIITGDDILGPAGAMLSIFIREPQFQGQTKEKLSNPEASRLIDNVVRDHFDHWLSGAPDMANALLAWVIERAEDRLKRRRERDISRKTATRRLRLPGKLADCSNSGAQGTELFIVEGDSAGGSAKQARNRKTQAILPLRGKILNVASATESKLHANQELRDLIQALGCGIGGQYREDDLRYDKIIVMTDADVDGAHIATLLMTFFYRSMPGLIENKHLFLAQPPLYRMSRKGKIAYARDDAHKDELIKSEFGAGKVELSRFKGLGEMSPAQLKATTMNPETRTLLQVMVPEMGVGRDETSDLVEHLMGRKPELRFAYIQENAHFVQDLDI
ncbi:MAG: DNA topoisomerase IV subunit B [Sphingomonadales bacterium]